MTEYYAHKGGLPPQTALTTDRSRFTESYVMIPRRTMSDITASTLPFWDATRLWVLARPLSGFSETFSHYLLEIGRGGGSDRPDDDPDAEAVLFVVDGAVRLTVDGTTSTVGVGGYAYVPPGATWSVRNPRARTARLHWVRKRYQRVEGIDAPPAFVVNEQDVEAVFMPGAEGIWSTSRFVEVDDVRHDMHVNIVTFAPGGTIPFPETHVMEHGIYVLEGKAMYLLNQDWVEVEAGDFMWLRAFCPQACYAGGPGRFRYLIFKDMNRHVPLRGVLR